MNSEVKQKWLAALRSGKYRQTGGQLRLETTEGSEFCCLGVLCEVAVEAGVVVREGVGYRAPRGQKVSDSLLPPAVSRWSGVSARAVLPDRAGSLVALNDSGIPFTRIADVIEEQL